MRRGTRALLTGAILAGLFSFLPVEAAQPRLPRVETGLLQRTQATDVIVRYGTEVPADVRAGGVAGLRVSYVFSSIPAVIARATPQAIRALAEDTRVAYLEPDKPIEFALDTATKASRAKEVFDPSYRPDEASPAILDAGGKPIDGTGVGIAIVDSGLDGLHPDFQAPGKVGGNFLATPAGLVAAPYSNTAAAHGTHVAGIAAGNGLSSGGDQAGAAPGATLYAFGVAPAGTVATASVAFDWILRNGARQNPPIRVLNNSWGCGSAACQQFNPYQVHQWLASKIAESGIVITWAVGNDGGTGWYSEVNPEATNPTPGIVGVANYNDQDRGRRDQCRSGSSSTGAAMDATTWPEVAAPGNKIMSTYALGPDQNSRRPDGANLYREMSGTSMAAPHVAGIVALMRQAAPGLTPAQIEYILKQTATPLAASCLEPALLRADPTHPWNGANYLSGHGLTDAYAAVRAAIDFTGIPPKPEAEVIPQSYSKAPQSVEVSRRYFMHPDGSLSLDSPGFDAPAATPLDANTPVSFTSAEFTEEVRTDGITVSFWSGTFAELGKTHFNNVYSRADVFRIPAGGEPELLANAKRPLVFTYSAIPYERPFVFPLASEVVFSPGDRLRVTVTNQQEAAIVTPDNPGPAGRWILYTGSASTAGHVGFGRAVRAEPGTQAECSIRMDCAEVGGAINNRMVLCGWPNSFELKWFGPPGSGIAVHCGSLNVSCVVAGLPSDPWGECETEGVLTTPLTHDYGYCSYFSANTTVRIGGKGRCISTVFVTDAGQRPV